MKAFWDLLRGLRSEGEAGRGSDRARALTPRAPRVTIGPLHRIACRLAPGTVVPVVNISVSGLALARHAVDTWPIPGASLAAELDIADRTHPVSLRLVHLTGGVAGCAFQQPNPLLVQAIESHLAAEVQAIDMVAMDSGGLQPGAEGTPHWYHGRSNSDLYYVERAGRVERFHLLFLGNYLEGGTARPIRFGVAVEDTDLSATDDDSVRWLDMLDAEQLSATLRFLDSIPGLDPAHRDAIRRLIC